MKPDNKNINPLKQKKTWVLLRVRAEAKGFEVQNREAKGTVVVAADLEVWETNSRISDFF